MSIKRIDPLLAIARGIIVFLMAVMIFAMTMVAIGAGAVVVMFPTVMAKLAEHGAPALSFWAILATLACAAAIVAVVYRFLDRLRLIVNTVDAGDPFIPVNADRLQEMAWLTIAMQVLTIPMASLGYWMATNLDNAKADIDVDIDINGVILALVLFILARVFRRGAEMREELEGTV
jgi:HAMP domain-containing protein